MANINRNGRNRVARHVRIDHSMMDTDAWRDLRGIAVKLLLHLAKMDNGTNNGSLFLSVRDAAKAIGVTINTAHTAFKDLTERGFVVPVARGHFQVKTRVATTWRLTWLPWPNRAGASHDYKKWVDPNKSRSQKLTSTVSKIETATTKMPVTVSIFDTEKPANPQNSVEATVSKIDTHTVAIGEALPADEKSEKYTPENHVGHFSIDMPEDHLRGATLTIVKQRGNGFDAMLANAAGIDKRNLDGFLHQRVALPAPSLARLCRALNQVAA